MDQDSNTKLNIIGLLGLYSDSGTFFKSVCYGLVNVKIRRVKPNRLGQRLDLYSRKQRFSINSDRQNWILILKVIK